METPEDPVETLHESITKPRKPPNISPEERAKRSARMKQIATQRIEMLRKQRGEATQPTPPTPVPEKEVKVRKPRAVKERPSTPIPPTPPPEKERVSREAVPEPLPPLKKQPAKRQLKVKTLVIQSSSDSEDYGDSDSTGTTDGEDEVVYVAKKSKSKSTAGMTKAKANTRTTRSFLEERVEKAVEPVVRIKFF